MNTARLIQNVRKETPLVHHITNYVTVNDCANITLAIGGSPIMADDIGEVEEITGIASSLVLNMGTLNQRTVPSMIAAGKKANEKGIPVVFDPVGAGVSRLRNETAKKILSEVKVSVLRGNISEIKFISGLEAQTRGVDASRTDEVQTESAKEIAKSLANRLDCVVAITGKTDIISDGKRIITIDNGHEKLSSITGTGCMCSSLIGAYVGANPNEIFEGTAVAIMTMGIAGELAFGGAEKLGNGNFRMAIHDEVSLMSAETIEKRGKANES